MLKRGLIIAALIVLSAEGIAQKTIEKGWEAMSIDTLVIDSDAVYNIQIVSEPSDFILVTTDIDGEHYESVVVNSLLKKSSLSISIGFKPYHKTENDKLAAHKLLSIEMNIVLPKNMVVKVKSELASVTAEGTFSYFEVALADGNCMLKDYIGNAQLSSIDGTIYASVLPGVSGQAISAYGDVENELPPNGWFKINAESKFGNIFLKKAEL